MTNTAPPLFPTIIGNRQIFPGPIADPAAAKIKAILELQIPRWLDSLLGMD
jgi:hypothetical protein